MTHAKYTRGILSEAVAASTSMADVLRHLGLRQNGGAHAHLRRRIDQLGIDTSHFLREADFRGLVSTRRRSHTEILVVRPVDAKREKALALRRALKEAGRAYLCAECGIADNWNGRPLTLHVDHIDGQFWDCRLENLRFLCPNCHSQTATYAGRNRQRSLTPYVRVDARGNAIDASPSTNALSEQETVEVLGLVASKQMTVSDAARAIGCTPHHVYQLQRRLNESGSLAHRARSTRIPEAAREAVVTFALRYPLLGGRNIASALFRQGDSQIIVSPSAIHEILKAAGLSTAEDRIAAAEKVRP
jgi:hypothetical protein